MKKAFTLIELVFVIIIIGILASIAGMFFVKTGKKSNLYKALNKGVFVASIVMVAGIIIIGFWG